MSKDSFAFLNAVIFSFDSFLINGEIEYLIAADKYMKKYRDMGGDMFVETERAIKEYLSSHTEKQHELKTH